MRASRAFGLLCTLVGCVHGAPLVSIRLTPVDSTLAGTTTHELIDRLQDETPGVVNRRWPALVTAFLPIDVSIEGEQNLPRDAHSPTRVLQV
jgi:hypothetical protein